MSNPRITPIGLNQITIEDAFWRRRIETNRCNTLPIEYQLLKATGRIDTWRPEYQYDEKSVRPEFWDSDLAKWLEAASYSLMQHPDPELAQQVDEVIDLIAAAQQPDGYLNSYFIRTGLEKRWRNIRDFHELYCLGHLIEGAVAHYQATGKRKFLEVMQRAADHATTVFGRGEGQLPAYPGHQEIELALVKLYHLTGEERYLRLAQFFVDERGQSPHYYDVEAYRRGEHPSGFEFPSYTYNQSHQPVREQTEVVGHSVRALYLYTGMAMVAAETGDQSLIDACHRLWQNLTEKKLFVTGGAGATYHHEGFSFDYDFPDETAYIETCASVALVFWAQQMFHLSPNRRFTDVMERVLYNSALSGVALDGKKFFYANPLAAFPGITPHGGYSADGAHHQRSEWFGVSCCPPNIAHIGRVLGSMSTRCKRRPFTLISLSPRPPTELAGVPATIRQTTDYP
ncbi:MAG: glycoside hydrolase family 127 protein [Caldilineaceae bacterium]